MIDQNVDGSTKEKVQDILKDYPRVFQGLGRLKNHKIKLHVDENVKPVRDSARTLPYHLEDRAMSEIQSMLTNDVIEEHPTNEPSPWLSNVVLQEKDDDEGGLRVTMDARNVNEAIMSSNLPIPKQEDIKAKLAHKKYFSKLDFKSAFWQLELAPESRYLTVFQIFNRLYRYKVLTMGLTPAQGELNAALAPLFAHIPSVHVIHDDVIIATDSLDEHLTALHEIMESISASGLTLNPQKCYFCQKEVKFWGMIFGEYGVRPDPDKVDDLRFITPPENKTELISFLCMMQSNSDFIPQFAKKSAILRDLTKGDASFKWESRHQRCFEQLVSDFKKDVTLRYFDISKPTFVITDAHKPGFGAVLAQGNDLKSAKAVAIASRRTSPAEQHYPQIDLEATGVDYGLTRYRNYLLGSPTVTMVITDHKPLVSIFNGRRKGSIRTERVKLRNQNINFSVKYQKGSSNQADYLSRHAKPFKETTEEERENANDVNKMLYMLHTTPVMDYIGLATISEETGKDPILSQLRTLLEQSKSWIPKNSPDDLKRFSKIMSELTVTGNGIILKSDRIVLPASLQQTAIELAHRGSHPAQCSMERRLRAHFFFHDMNIKVGKFLSSCLLCNTFNDKKTLEPLGRHEVPSKCWDTVAVDLFGPMPSRNHVVVVQDLASKFPAAKLVSSTSAERVLPALGDIYNTLGNPNKQISDNGPPFNAQSMNNFAEKRGINLHKIPPLHPSSNPAETFMRPLGKAMKIAHTTRSSEKDAIQHLLNNYRNTPHPATGVSPSSMLFRDGQRCMFPRTSSTDEDIAIARERDLCQKEKQQNKVNSGKYRIESHIDVGDEVLVRNYQKQRKFDPTFLPTQFIVIGATDNGHCLTLQSLEDGNILKRHADDVKKFSGHIFPHPLTNQSSEQELLNQHLSLLSQAADNDEGDNIDTTGELVQQQQQQPQQQPQQHQQQQPQHPHRIRHHNPRYFNEDFVNHLSTTRQCHCCAS